MDQFPATLRHLLQCPVCAHELESMLCANCQTEFFNFGGIASFMPAGKWQLPLWQHQLAVSNQQAQLGLDAMHAMLERADLVPSTYLRIQESLSIAQASNQSINELMHDAGISAQHDEQFAHLNLGPISEYYHHILQDWAWESDVIEQRLTPILAAFNPTEVGAVLVLGAGAGRLSWELHKTWGAQITLATDINPLLLAVSHKLIKQREPFNFYELNSFPQIHLPLCANYLITPTPDLEDKQQNWFAMAADVWHMPIKPNSLDVILTAWFIDVHGGDNRVLISHIQQWLKPGGVWINSGPLLYPKAAPLEFKYGRDDLLELIELAGLELISEQINDHPHLKSPINARQQTEQVWTFCVCKSAELNPRSNPSLPPAWLIYHHLPVPKISTPPQQSHPLIDRIIALADGAHSIDLICALTAPFTPEGLDPKTMVVEVLNELLT
jgi:SAM-dependent methyltransferase